MPTDLWRRKHFRMIGRGRGTVETQIGKGTFDEAATLLTCLRNVILSEQSNKYVKIKKYYWNFTYGSLVRQAIALTTDL